jgi:hydrophobic/amphiphilic exporter-1 (mainly G- bacteria), HAE1 family
MTLTELAIKRPSLIIVIFTALAVLGIFSFNQLNYELLPKFTPPIVTVTTIYPGASPSEVETGVTKLFEDALSGIDKISEIRSQSFEGVSFVVIELLQSADPEIALQDAQRKIGEVLSKLPSGAKSPTISKFAFDEIPVIRSGVTSNLPPKEFYTFLKDQIKPQLSKIAGVGQINLIGGDEREIQVNLDRQKLKSFGFSILQVTTIIKASNLDFPTGNIKDSDEQFVVRIAGKFTSLDELRNLAIGTSRTGGTIKLGDVAEINDGIKDYTNHIRINGVSTVALNISKQSDANAVEVSKSSRQIIADLEKKYKTYDLKFNIAQDGSLFTIDAANAVKKDLAVAVVLVALVMLMFLHSVRNSLIVMIAIPSSLISTFALMYAFNFTLNLMTLLGLSLVVGILVDDSIVVLENIYHHIEKGEEKSVAALRGRNEIGFAALAITLVDVVVFLPIALVGGIIGNIMRQFALVVVFSTLMSLFVSFTITPMLASRFAKLERLTNRTLLGRFALWFEKIYHIITEDYIKILKWSLINKGKVAIATIILFVASFALIPLGFIGSEFISVADRGEFAVTIELSQGAKLEETNRTSRQVENMLNSLPEVEKTFANAGASNEGLIGFTSNNTSEISVTLVNKNQRKKSTDEMIAEIKEKLTLIPGIKARVNPIGIFGVANQTPIQLLITGPNYDDVISAANIVEEKVKKIKGASDVRLSAEQGKPETRIVIDREKMNSLGLTLAEVGQTLRIALTGDDESKLRDGSNEFDIRIRLDEFDRSRTADIKNITFVNRKGQQIELEQFASIERNLGPTKLQRQDRNASVTLFSQVVGRPSGSLSNDIETELKKIDLPKGVSYSFSGDVKNQRESFADLALALLAAVIFTYLIMVALYNSFIYPLVVLFSIPLAMIGAFVALALSFKALSIFSILGIIMLVGLVGKNAILLVDRTNAVRSEGLGVYEALIDAGNMRLRPILMTTFTMIFGMMPIALSASAGGEWKSGLAWAIIGGLTSSLVLTLIIVPIVYSKVEELRISIPAFVRRIIKRKQTYEEPIREPKVAHVRIDE